MKPDNFTKDNVVFFRADASPEIGFGHLIRCIYLAKFLKNKGLDVRFFCQALPEFIIDKLKNLKIPIYSLPNRRLGDLDNCRADVNSVKDEIEQISIRPDWLIIDHYLIDSSWENGYKIYFPETKILVLDDLANRNHFCDVLVDSGVNSSNQRYKDRVSDNCKQFHGTKFVFIDYHLLQYRRQEPINDFTHKQVHIFMGSQDTNQLTTKFTKVFLKFFKNVSLDIVVGPNYKNQGELKELAKKSNKIVLDIAPITMVNSLLNCNMAFGAPGVTTWERAFLGIPAIYVSTHSNQEKILKGMADKGFCSYLGNAQALSEKKLIDGVNQFINNQKYLYQLSLNSLKVVDGLGVSRIGEYLCLKL